MRPSTDYGREDIVRFLYLDDVLRGKKVLVLGPDSDVVKQIFQQIGCRSVKLFRPGREAMPDWDLTSLRGKRDAVGEGRGLLPFGPGSFDVIFIPDLSAVEDYRLVLSESARVAGDDGLVIISARNAECTVSVSQSGLEETPDIWSLESLEELTGTYFEHIEHVGQCPFLAYACVSYDPARASEGVRLDTSLMGERSEEPEFFLLLCCRRPPSLEVSNAVYQIPMSEMTVVEAPEAGDEKSEPVDAESLKVANEMLKKEAAEKNVLISRLKKELERVEGEAEERRQKMFDMKQKMEKDRKSTQKEVLEKAIQKQVDKIPETWMGERNVLMKEMEQIKQDNKTLAERNRKLEAESERFGRELEELRKKRDDGGEWKREREVMRKQVEMLKKENRALLDEKRTAGDAAASGPSKERVEELERRLAARDALVGDLLHEMELMPQIGFGDDVPAGEEDVIELVGRMEEMKKNLADGGEAAAALKSEVQELELSLQEEKMRSSTREKENRKLRERVKDLVATTNMLSDLASTLPGPDVEKARADFRKMEAVVRFSLGELERLAGRIADAGSARQLALLWATIEERRRMVIRR